MRIPQIAGQGRWVTRALVASLLLNGFLIGLLVTDALRGHGRHKGGSPRAIGFELRQIAEKLPRADVDRIRAELERVSPAIRERIDRLRAIRADVYALAAAPEPDRAAIDARLEELRREVSAMQDSVQRATFDALLRLPPETRRGLSEAPQG